MASPPPPPKRFEGVSKVWVQVVGTRQPTLVTCTEDDSMDELKKAAIAQMSDCLRVSSDEIIVCMDKEGHDRLAVDFTVSNLKGNSAKKPIWLALCEANVKVEVNYVERDFAKLDDLSRLMKDSSRAVLYFCGPTGTGKTTTLIKLYKHMLSEDPPARAFYVNARLDEKLGVPARDAYIFVDEAQCLRENKTLCKDLQRGKAYCLAFSPVVSTSAGYATLQCPYHYTKIYRFRPFSESEVTELSESVTEAKKECIEEAKKVGVLIPRMFDQCQTFSEIIDWINTAIVNLLLKVRARLSSNDYQDELCRVLLKGAMGDPLNSTEKTHAINSGFFYMDESSDLHLIFPPSFMVPHLYTTISSIYSLMRGFDAGMAFEFLVHAKLQVDNNEIRCMAEKPSALGERESTMSTSNATAVIQIVRCEECINQRSSGDDLKHEKSFCLVKLYTGHYAVDFLIICNAYGTASKRLFFVQASVQKYQERGDRKLSSLYVGKAEFGGKSVLQFYSDKLGFQTSQCFYVYACPEIPKDKGFSRKQTEQEKVYFLQVK